MGKPSPTLGGTSSGNGRTSPKLILDEILPNLLSAKLALGPQWAPCSFIIPIFRCFLICLSYLYTFLKQIIKKADMPKKKKNGYSINAQNISDIQLSYCYFLWGNFSFIEINFYSERQNFQMMKVFLCHESWEQYQILYFDPWPREGAISNCNLIEPYSIARGYRRPWMSTKCKARPVWYWIAVCGLVWPYVTLSDVYLTWSCYL